VALGRIDVGMDAEVLTTGPGFAGSDGLSGNPYNLDKVYLP
jgi:hypothetical protein